MEVENKQDEESPPLGGTKRDLAVSIVKGLAGTVPLAGSILAEVISTIIPEQRTQRLEDYVRHLNDRLEQIEANPQRASDPEAIDLFEEGAVQSARALSDERREQISRLVAHGIAGEEKERIEAKRLLSLLRQIDDEQIVILASHLDRNSQNEEFYKTHEKILVSPGAHLGSDQEEVDRELLFKLARDNLEQLGLLRSHFRTPKKGEMPEFDPRTGMLKARYRDLSPLGRLLLTRVGLATPGEF